MFVQLNPSAEDRWEGYDKFIQRVVTRDGTVRGGGRVEKAEVVVEDEEMRERVEGQLGMFSKRERGLLRVVVVGEGQERD